MQPVGCGGDKKQFAIKQVGVIRIAAVVPTYSVPLFFSNPLLSSTISTASFFMVRMDTVFALVSANISLRLCSC